MKRLHHHQRAFTILEMIMAMAIFLIICAAMFELLNLSQKKYSSETQLTAAFQDARLAMDQIVRDVNISGYPSPGMISNPTNSASYAASPFAWGPGYASNTTCQIGVTCSPTPGDYDLIVETDFGSGVSWIRYQLVGTTLYRGVVPKAAGSDPVSATSASGVMTPFLANVVNNASGALLGQITAQYPSMFPAGQPQPIFQYACDTPGGPTPSAPCPLTGVNNSPKNVRDVSMTLIVMTPQRDVQTQNLMIVELNGSGHRVNPVN
jgi:prepilin-type N-terminal cleavage/methylation domain-containing protein